MRQPAWGMRALSRITSLRTHVGFGGEKAWPFALAWTGLAGGIVWETISTTVASGICEGSGTAFESASVAWGVLLKRERAPVLSRTEKGRGTSCLAMVKLPCSCAIRCCGFLERRALPRLHSGRKIIVSAGVLPYLRYGAICRANWPWW